MVAGPLSGTSGAIFSGSPRIHLQGGLEQHSNNVTPVQLTTSRIMKTRLIGAFAAILCSVSIAAPASASDRTITQIVARSGGTFDSNPFDYDMLLNAVLAADLAEALNNPNDNLTLFAPNDLAFIRLARDLGYDGFDEEGAFGFIVEALTDIGGGNPIPVLTNVLLYHVAPERLGAISVLFSSEIDTLLDGAVIRPFFFTLRDNEPDLRDPNVFIPFNVRASNGVVHTINRVLIPVDL